jgi:hypothetical protein
MILMAFMLLVIVVSYLLMLALVRFAEGVIDKALPAKLHDAILSSIHRFYRLAIEPFVRRLSVVAGMGQHRRAATNPCIARRRQGYRSKNCRRDATVMDGNDKSRRR